jgi:hypothetical protein
MAFGYHAPLNEAFKMEEWEDPYHYADIPEDLRKKNLRLFGDFRRGITEAVKGAADFFSDIKFSKDGLLDSDMKVIVLNCVGIDRKSARGTELFSYLAGDILSGISARHGTSLALGEAVIGTPAYDAYKRAGAVEIRSAFGKSSTSFQSGDPVLIAYRVDDFRRAFGGTTQ